MENRFPYYNRELSWMDFNMRVLEESMKKENPLMERLRFLSISGSNLDEFFMVRVAGVKEQVRADYKTPDPSGLTPQKLLTELNAKTHAFMEKQYSIYTRSILPLLRRCGIRFVDGSDLSPQQQSYVADYFHRVLFPVLTPLAVDTSRPFPFLANKTLNIAVRLSIKKEKGAHFAVVQVPGILPRFLEIPEQEGRTFILLEDLIIHFMPELFDLQKIEACCPFRLTRDSDLEIDEEAEDFLNEIQKSIKRRKHGRPVRLELLSHCDDEIRAFLTDSLKVKPHDIYEITGPLDLTFLGKFTGLSGFESMCYEPVRPVYPPADFWGYENIFDAIREKDRLVHHPYDSFECVVDFVRTAAEDPNVLAIKQTLYRVSGHSPIVAALIRAAENGKQVTVLVELKARFDEENNIIWARKLEKAGCHVIYGLTGLKTHCKICLVVRREEDGIRRYVHLGTGNYNDSTARIYTDLGMFTCRESYGSDASSLFNVITGYSLPPTYHKFAVAPLGLRTFFSRMIEREIENAQKGLPCGITAKINSLVDPEIIGLLYKASSAGVPIFLIVRGICCLTPGIEGVSDNITVISIVGLLLEHSRIFLFENGGNRRVYLGSADWMQRNLDRRIELVFPVEDEDLKARVLEILETMKNDTVNARMQLPDTSYVHIDRRGRGAVNCHRLFADRARQEFEDRKSVKEDKPFQPIRSNDLKEENP